MTEHNHTLELRKYERFPPGQGGIAMFSPPDSPIPVIVGEIMDISEGGIAFVYKAKELEMAKEAQVSDLQMFVYKDPFLHIDHVHCKIVYDEEIDDESGDAPRSRRCGIEFEQLSEEQLEQLRDFIERFSMKPS